MENCEELITFIKLWSFAISSLSYCYFISNRISSGYLRLLCFLPVISAFFLLPLPLTAVHFTLNIVFHLVWLANFKLLLLAFNCGPLASKPPLEFIVFIAIAVLPIHPKQSIKEISNPEYSKLGIGHSVQNVSHEPKVVGSIKDAHVNYLVYKKNPNFDPLSLLKPILLVGKALLLVLILNAYPYRGKFNQIVILLLYFIHFYLFCELICALAIPLVWLIIGYDFKIEPQFNEPYLATSLQDFWGRRWNRMASKILRPIFYDPVRVFSTPILGKLWGQMLGIFVTFVASGYIHELMYFYVIRLWPTWEVTWFFVLHGVCTAAEVGVKERVKGRFQLHRAISGLISMTFVIVTGFWLFFPQIVRNGVDVRAINEYSILVRIFRSIWE